MAISQATQPAPLPALNKLYGEKLETTVEQIVRFLPPDTFEEKMLFRELISENTHDGLISLVRKRTLLASWIDGQKIPGPELSEPLVSVEVHPKGEWPQVGPDPIEDIRTFRLWRATRYVPIASFALAGDVERRVPAATYRASMVKGEIHTVFAESGGLTARGVWKLNEHQRLASAKIVCEKAFAPGGDGTAATVTFTITAQKT